MITSTNDIPNSNLHITLQRFVADKYEIFITTLLHPHILPTGLTRVVVVEAHVSLSSYGARLPHVSWPRRFPFHYRPMHNASNRTPPPGCADAFGLGFDTESCMSSSPPHQSSLVATDSPTQQARLFSSLIYLSLALDMIISWVVSPTTLSVIDFTPTHVQNLSTPIPGFQPEYQRLMVMKTLKQSVITSYRTAPKTRLSSFNHRWYCKKT